MLRIPVLGNSFAPSGEMVEHLGRNLNGSVEPSVKLELSFTCRPKIKMKNVFWKLRRTSFFKLTNQI